MAQAFKRKTSQGIGTSQVQLGGYTVAAGVTATIFGLTLCNISGSDITVSLWHWDGAVTTKIVSGAPIKAGGTLVPIGWAQRIALQPGDQIFASASAASSVDAIMSVLELS